MEDLSPELLEALRLGPDPSDTGGTYRVLVCAHSGAPAQEYSLPGARRSYFPSPEHPTHILVWTSWSAHVFRYHCVDCAYFERDHK